MAYSFDNVLGILGKKPQENADIFGNSGTQAGQNPGNAPAPRTNSESDLGPAGSDVANAKNNAATDPSDVSSSAAYRSNIGKTAAPANMAALKSGVEAKDKALTDEANSYVANSTLKYRNADSADPNAYGLSGRDADLLHGAIDKNYKAGPSGDQPLPYDTGAKPREDLGYWQTVASGQVDTVNPFKSTMNLLDPTIENLGTDAGVQNLLRRNNGPTYNKGDAAFDQALLNEDQGFQQNRQDTLERYGALQKRGGEIGDKTTAAGQQAVNAAQSAYLGDLKSKLGGFANQFTTEAQQREKDIEAQALARQREIMGSAGGFAANEARNLGGVSADPLAQYYTAEGLSDPSQYIKSTFDPNAQDYKSYLSDDDAMRFNNVMGLLGAKDVYTKGSRSGGYSDADLVSYDKTGLDSALRSGAQSRAEAAAIQAEKGRVAAAEQEAAAAAAAAASAGNAPAPAGTPTKGPGSGTATDPNTYLPISPSTKNPVTRATDVGEAIKAKTPISSQVDHYLPQPQVTKKNIRKYVGF